MFIKQNYQYVLKTTMFLNTNATKEGCPTTYSRHVDPRHLNRKIGLGQMLNFKVRIYLEENCVFRISLTYIQRSTRFVLYTYAKMPILNQHRG